MNIYLHNISDQYINHHYLSERLTYMYIYIYIYIHGDIWISNMLRQVRQIINFMCMESFEISPPTTYLFIVDAWCHFPFHYIWMTSTSIDIPGRQEKYITSNHMILWTHLLYSNMWCYNLRYVKYLHDTTRIHNNIKMIPLSRLAHPKEPDQYIYIYIYIFAFIHLPF